MITEPLKLAVQAAKREALSTASINALCHARVLRQSHSRQFGVDNVELIAYFTSRQHITFHILLNNNRLVYSGIKHGK